MTFSQMDCNLFSGLPFWASLPKSCFEYKGSGITVPIYKYVCYIRNECCVLNEMNRKTHFRLRWDSFKFAEESPKMGTSILSAMIDI